jgi:signal transduction histidine kinase
MFKEKSIIEAIFIISAVFALVGVFVIAYLLYFNKRKSRLLLEQNRMQEEFNKQLLQSQIEVQEATFSTLGKELHDNIGQLLGTAKMLIGVSRRNLPAAEDTIRTADETLGKAIYELRSLSKTLNKEWLERFDLKDNLHTEAERISAAGIVHVKVHDDTTTIALAAEAQLVLFRIVQEAMQNAVKHSGAGEIGIWIKEQAGELSILITDDGKGFTLNAKPNGVGMLNMKHRISLLNGKIEWKNTGAGTHVSIRLPNKSQDV